MLAALTPAPAWPYATPVASRLSVTPADLPGNNTPLRPQAHLGFDLGTDWTPRPGASVSLAGVHAVSRNALISPSPGGRLLICVFHARGLTRRFDRAGNHIPGVPANQQLATTRSIYARAPRSLAAGMTPSF